jgi:hypothetical protein
MLLKVQFKNYILSLASLFILFNSSCEKKNANGSDTLPDITYPVIKYTKPTNGAVLNSILPINIIGTITDNKGLKSYSLKVFNLSENKLDFSIIKDLSGTTGHTINENFVKNNPNKDIFNYMLASETKDAANNTVVDTIKFFVQ